MVNVMEPEPLNAEELRVACEAALRWIVWVRGSNYQGDKEHQPAPALRVNEVLALLFKALRKEKQ